MKIIRKIQPIADAEKISDIREEIQREPVVFGDIIIYQKESGYLYAKIKSKEPLCEDTAIIPKRNQEYFGSIVGIKGNLYAQYSEYGKHSIDYIVYDSRNNIHEIKMGPIRTFCIIYPQFIEGKEKSIENVDFSEEIKVEIRGTNETEENTKKTYVLFRKKNGVCFEIEDIKKICQDVNALLSTTFDVAIGYERVLVSDEENPKRYMVLDLNMPSFTLQKGEDIERIFPIDTEVARELFSSQYIKFKNNLSPLYLYRAFLVSSNGCNCLFESLLEFPLHCVEQLYEMDERTMTANEEKRKEKIEKFVKDLNNDNNYKEEKEIIKWIEDSEGYYIYRTSYSEKMKKIYKENGMPINHQYSMIANNVRNDLSHKGIFDPERCIVEVGVEPFFLWLKESVHGLLLKRMGIGELYYPIYGNFIKED